MTEGGTRDGNERREGIPYLSVCACLGYDAPYLFEWIEFHRLVGIERFFLYNNGDRENQRKLLAPYVEDGTVVLHEWTVFPPQIPAFTRCLEQHRDDSRWIAFIDTDEFLFSPTGAPLSEVLVDYERWPGVGVCRAFFGPSGHRSRPEGLVIESYIRRLTQHFGSIFVKSIVDPSRAERPRNPHWFRYTDGEAVDENQLPLDGQSAQTLTYERLRINHYWTRSEQESYEKFSRLRPDTGDNYRRTAEEMRTLDISFGRFDDTILGYVPAVKEAVARAQERAGEQAETA